LDDVPACVESDGAGGPTRGDLAIRRMRGRWIRPFEGGPKAYFLSAVQGCPWACTYCFVQGYLDHGGVVVHSNTGDMKTELMEFLAAPESRGATVHAAHLGELAPWEAWTGLCGALFEAFASHEHATLEIRTKSDAELEFNRDPVPPNIVLSWTLTPESISSRHEKGLPGPEARIDAARRAILSGARVGIRLDPILLEDGWREAYAELALQLGEVFSDLPLESVEMGTFRCSKKSAEAMRTRRGKSILAGELLLDSRGKVRYFWPLRVEAYRFVAEAVRDSLGKPVPLRLCMEPPWVWERALGRIWT
jgi:spore photoproduct lyase